MRYLLFLACLAFTSASAQICVGPNNVLVGDCYSTNDRFTAAGAVSTSATPPYGYKDGLAVEFTGSDTARGASSHSDARVYTGSGPANHIHSYQALTLQLLNDGNVEWYRGFTAGPVIGGNGTVANVALHNAENPTGSGAITNLYGLRCSTLNRGTANWCVYADGTTPSWYGGQVRSGSAFTVTKDGSNDVAAGPFFMLSNASGNRLWLFQLNADNDVDVWNYNGSAWIVMLTLTHGGVKVPSLAGSGDRTVKATSAGLLIAP